VMIPRDPEGSESPDTADRDRATHWGEFYDRVILFEETILSQMVDLSSEMTEEEQRLVKETNTGPLSSMIEDFRARRDLWRRAAQKDESTG
jgi:hypothetical protein